MRDDKTSHTSIAWTLVDDIPTLCSHFFDQVGSGYQFEFLLCTFILFSLAAYLAIFGYRFHRLSAFLICGLLGSSFTFSLCSSEEVFEPYINAAIAIIAGFLSALIAALHRKIGFFVTGAVVGAITGVYVTVLVIVVFSFSWLWLGLTFVFTLAVVHAVASLLLARTLSILNTSLISGFLVFVGCDYLLERWVMVHFGWVLIVSGQRAPVCGPSWLAMLVWPLVFALAMLTQLTKTSRYYDHNEEKKARHDGDEVGGGTPKRSANNTLRSGKGTFEPGGVTGRTRTAQRQYSQSRNTGDIVPRDVANTHHAIPATMQAGARARAMQDGVGPEYQVVGSTVYYGDNYSMYSQGGGGGHPPRVNPAHLAQTLPNGGGGMAPLSIAPPYLQQQSSTQGGPRYMRRSASKANRQSSGTNDSLYEDLDDSEYCAVDYDMIRQYEYGYAQGGQYAGGQQTPNHYRQQSRTSTLGSTRSGGGGGGGQQRRAPGGGGGALYQQVSQMSEAYCQPIGFDPQQSVGGGGPTYNPGRNPPMPPAAASQGPSPNSNSSGAPGGGGRGAVSPKPEGDDYLSPVMNSVL